MELRTIMTTDPASCTQGTALADVARLMREYDCGAIPVLDDETSRRPIGVVTDRDIVVRLVADDRDPTTATASDCMTTPAYMITDEASLADACHLMETRKVRRVVVVDTNGQLCGMVALADVALSGLASSTVDVVKEVSEPG
jgi:CBS domain-containing protein